MKKIFSVFLLLVLMKINAQFFGGQVYMREDSSIYLNQVYVTNLSEQKTVLSNYNGEFKIQAKVGDVVRFTSIISERKDVKITDEILKNPINLISLSPGYHNIKEIVIRFKPSGNLRKDVLSLRQSEKNLAIAAIVGLPESKGDGRSPVQPIASFQGGGLSFSLEGIYEVISGERKKKERLYEYEKMMKSVSDIKNYFGEDYFIKLKIPKNMIDNFLQFVYSSDNLATLLNGKNIEATSSSIEKFLPIYLKRLQNSQLTEILTEKASI